MLTQYSHDLVYDFPTDGRGLCILSGIWGFSQKEKYSTTVYVPFSYFELRDMCSVAHLILSHCLPCERLQLRIDGGGIIHENNSKPNLITMTKSVLEDSNMLTQK